MRIDKYIVDIKFAEMVIIVQTIITIPVHLMHNSMEGKEMKEDLFRWLENQIVEAKLNEARELLDNSDWWHKSERLYQCSAVTFQINNLIFLKSYNTIIACIDKDSDTCYDWLRLVYGYTNTSAQHIRKFMKKYGIVTKKTWHK